MADAAVQLTDLRFAWPAQARPCLDIAAFTVAAGESVFVHGESGSGKSTLLALLGGVLVPQAGSVRVLGTELTQLSAGSRDRFRVDHIGFLFQQFNLIPYLSMQDNVLLPCRFSARRRSRALARSATLAAEAKRLLAEPDTAIAEVATACGFTSQAGLYNYFKRHAGIGPSEFRAMAVRGESA